MKKEKSTQSYYNSEEYEERLAAVQEEAERIRREQELEARIKEKEVQVETEQLKKIFTEARCGAENMHFVLSLIDRASFLRVEIAHIERRLQSTGMMDFFTQGTQTLWREHPLSKILVQHSKSYRETIKQLESYSKADEGTKTEENPVYQIIGKNAKAREKYKK